MNNRFEWEASETGSRATHSCWLGNVQLGWVVVEDDRPAIAGFGDVEGCIRTEWCPANDPTLDEAKAWVEAKARAWLAEVTA